MKLLLFIYILNCLQYLKVVSNFFCRHNQRLNIFGKATTTITDSRKKETFTNPIITTNTATNHIYIST